MRKLAVALALAVLSGCAYDGGYRYPCQDPANWTDTNCEPPICSASETCTKDLLPEEVLTDGSIVPEP